MECGLLDDFLTQLINMNHNAMSGLCVVEMIENFLLLLRRVTSLSSTVECRGRGDGSFQHTSLSLQVRLKYAAHVGRPCE